MTTRKNSRRSRARAGAEPRAGLPDATQVALVGQLRRMAVEVGHLQSELAAVESQMTAAPADWPPARSGRPGSGWTPTPEPQPWLDVRSA